MEGNTTLVRDLRDYVDVAVRLGRPANRARREGLRAELVAGRWTSPMSDTRRPAPQPARIWLDVKTIKQLVYICL